MFGPMKISALWILIIFVAGESLANPKFEKIGKLFSQSSYAHLHVEVNISRIYETAANLTQAVDELERKLDNVRSDGRCGVDFPKNGSTSFCNLNSHFPCCSEEGYCIGDLNHHSCVNHGTQMNNRRILREKQQKLKRTMNILAEEIRSQAENHAREKREINVSFDVGAIFMHVVNGIVSLFNSHQISDLKQDQQHMIKTLHRLNEKINQLYASLSEMNHDFYGKQILAFLRKFF